MKELENQGLFRRYAHQDENKAHIDEEAKLLDEAMQRFDVSFQVTFVVDSPHIRVTAQINMQISVLHEQLCMKSALVELDGVSRERHDEILVVSQMTGKEREVCILAIYLLL